VLRVCFALLHWVRGSLQTWLQSEIQWQSQVRITSDQR
jgi:hypothetical protein